MAQRTGAYEPIPDVDGPHVREMGEFAVAEHNKQTGQKVVFVGVVSGERQVVAGTNYKLVIEAEDAGARSTYEAVVYDRPWDNHRELASFKQIISRAAVKRGWHQFMCCARV